MTLSTICYVSTAVAPFNDSEIASLLEVARARNSAVGVTGLLLYCDGNFMQYIEGEPEHLEPIWECIQRDRRHTNVSAVFRNTTTERLFAAWSMAFDSRMPAGLDDLLAQARQSPNQDRWAETIGRLLLTFWQQSWTREFRSPALVERPSGVGR